MRFKALFDTLQNSINAKINKAELGRIIGLSRSGVDYNLKNNTLIDDTDVQKIETYYNVRLLGGMAVSSNNMVTISASCGNGIINIDADYMQLDGACKYIYVIAAGDSMQPAIYSGDLVIIRLQGYTSTQNGIYCFTYEDKQYIKHLCYDINRLVISSDNSKYSDVVLCGDELDKIKIIGECVGIIRRF